MTVTDGMTNAQYFQTEAIGESKPVEEQKYELI